MAVVFHSLLTVEEAIRKVEEALGGLQPSGNETVSLHQALGRVLAEEVSSQMDSPPFDRSEVDGYAVRSSDLAGADEDNPIRLRIIGRSVVGRLPPFELADRTAAQIATGAPLPKGADSVVMVEYAKDLDGDVAVYRATSPNENVAQTGSDVTLGDSVLQMGAHVSPREVAMLASIGVGQIQVYKKPRVTVFSTGDELVNPDQPLSSGTLYDANGPAIAALTAELGLQCSFGGIIPDVTDLLLVELHKALSFSEVVLTSGSTSAGLGDQVYKVFDSLGKPGVVVHGLKIKPGKPTVAAVADGKLLIGLPGFPVSAMTAFSVFVKPILLRLAGHSPAHYSPVVNARISFRIHVGKGKREYVPVNVVSSPRGLVAYPLLGGSGAVSTLASADGFVEVEESKEMIEENEPVVVRPFHTVLKLADLDIIGSHCPGVDLLLRMLRGFEAKRVNVGSTGGWLAVARGEADIAGTHLLDEESQEYNVPFLERFRLHGRAILVRGYRRKQGFGVLRGNPKRIKGFEDLLRSDVAFVNRNKGSGTRALLDYHLSRLGVGEKERAGRIKGYLFEAKSHSAVAAAVSQGRADVGVLLEHFAHAYDLEFTPLSDELFDFLVLKERLEKPAVSRFLGILGSREFAANLQATLKGFSVPENCGESLG